MSRIFEIVVFTASQKLYADKVLDLIDPKKRIAHRLYREHCVVINKTYYLKNLKILGRDLNQTVIVDVLHFLSRITPLPDCCTPITSTVLSLLMATPRTGSCVVFLLF